MLFGGVEREIVQIPPLQRKPVIDLHYFRLVKLVSPSFITTTEKQDARTFNEMSGSPMDSIGNYQGCLVAAPRRTQLMAVKNCIAHVN